MRAVTGKPIKFAGTGEKLDALEPFRPDRVAGRILGMGDVVSLVERAADVAIKEGRPLIVVPRETPLSELHLENMLKLTRLGAVVLPAMPGFYQRPKTLEELVDFVVGKILDRLGVQHELVARWRTPKASSSWNEGEE